MPPSAILDYHVYIPRRRLQRQAVVEANAWFNPALKALGRGERAIANWDEDAVTMAVEAARGALAGAQRAAVAQLMLATTTAPFADRQNAGIVAAALDLPRAIGTLDTGGSMRAGTSALMHALRIGARTLVVAADKRRTRVASPQELAYGDGAAAFVVGEGEPIARVLAMHSESVDFVDHFRGRGPAAEFDYAWEERWVRDEGYFGLIPRALGAALAAAGLSPADVAMLCVPLAMRGAAQGIAKRAGIAEDRLRDTFAANLGDTGVAHPLLMLADALDGAQPGQRIVVIGFGQGVDVLVLEATEALARRADRGRLARALARRRADANYARYLAINDLVTLERGMRAEGGGLPPTLSSGYRNREMLLGLIGGKCRRCGAVQYPKTQTCVAPACNAVDSQDDHPFADLPASIMSYTADALTYSPDPPACYGMVLFEGGGRMMADFTDVDSADLTVGMPMRMVFRVREFDAARGYTRYFWKATPVQRGAAG